MESPSFLFFVGALLLFLFVFLRPRAQLRQRAEAARPAGGESEEVRRELDGLAIQLQELSREQMARLDTKMKVLNQMLVDAERTIAELKAATAEARAQGVAAPPAATAPPKPVDPLHERIFALAQRGAPLAEIAAATGLPAGEVELILGLQGGGAAER
jgi:hypothetical protein